MQVITASAPGSLMLFGEHAVVRGGLGIAVSLAGRVNVRLTPRTDSMLVIHSDRFKALSCSIDALADSVEHAYTLGVFRYFQAQLSHGYEIDIHSELSPTHGFGSSAALVVALVAALQPTSTCDVLQIAAQARDIIIAVQGGGSGCDAYASALGGVVAIDTVNGRVRVLEHLALSPPLTAIYTGYKTKTPVVLAHVAAWEQQMPTQYAALFQQMNALSEAAIPCLKSEDWLALGQLMRQQFMLQQALGVADDISVKIMLGLDSLQARTGLPLGAKISGSGLGDCLIALGELPDKLFPNPQLPATEQFALTLGLVGVSAKTINASSTAKADERISSLGLDLTHPKKSSGYGEAPVNIALIKYWGKRCASLNLPVTDSLSVTVPDTLTRTRIKIIEGSQDILLLNRQAQSPDSKAAKRLSVFLNYFRSENVPFFEVDTQNTVATAAGLASSASGFAALVLALKDLFGWDCDEKIISILARLGSGSACRSLWPGFVHWQAGVREDGLDSYALPLAETWPGLMLGLVIVDSHAKAIGSREAMQLTTETSPLYQAWPATVAQHLSALRQAISAKDFMRFGEIAEHNALSMHATMLASWPSVDYRTPATWAAIHKVYELRRNGVPVYFTQDAGPNIKLLFEVAHQAYIKQAFAEVDIKALF